MVKLGINKRDLKSPKLQKSYIVKPTDRSITTKQRFNIIKKAGFKCAECKRTFKKDPSFLEVDHKEAVHKSVKDILHREGDIAHGHKKPKQKHDRDSNLQVLCRTCHLKKSKLEAKQRAIKKKKSGLLYRDIP